MADSTDRTENPGPAGEAPPPAASIQPLPEDWTRGLCVVAHPDDIEYGAAMAVAKWTSQGKEVAYVLATAGEAGIDSMAPEDAGIAREQEQRASARIVGVDSVTFLGQTDGVLEHGLALRRMLAREIRRHRPEVVISVNFRLTFGSAHPDGGGGPLNQAAHRALGLSLIDAVRDAGNRWVFDELLTEDFQPWTGVRLLAFAGSPRPTHGVDVAGFLDDGVRSLQAHRTYLDNLAGSGTDPQAFLAHQVKAGGALLGVPHAITFEVFEL